MKRLVTAFVAMLALAAPVHATDVGAVLSFKGAGPMSPAGCNDFNQAYELFRLRTLHGAARVNQYVSRTEWDFVGGRACAVFDDPNAEWRVMRKHRTEYTAPTNAWFCIEMVGGFDVRSPEEREKAEREKTAKPLPCFWVHLEDKP